MKTSDAPPLSPWAGFSIVALGVFILGAIVGLALFSQVLYVALQRAHDIVLAALIGLMAGSIRVLWPWPNGVESTELGLPEGDWIAAAGLAVIAFVIIIVVARFAQGLEAADEHPDAEPPGSDDTGDPEQATEPREASTA
jgi:uncharacterized membrane protein